MAPELKIVIGADIGSAIAGVSKLTDAMQGVSNSAGDAAGALSKIPAALRPIDPGKVKAMQEAIQKLKQDIAKFPREPIPDPFKNIPKGSNQATNALTNLSRVAQDAPFGFIGIQNNLNPLLESFGRLKQETGSSGAALKALGSSLAGPAGVGLALGVVTGLITVAIQKYGSLGNAIDALTSSVSGAAQAQRDIAKAFAAAEGSAAGEIASVNALLAVARNETLSKKARAEAINKLNQEYDAYLPKLTQENINTQAVTEAVDKLTNSLVRQAKIKGLQDLISKETAKQAELFAGSLGENAGAIDNIIASLKALSPAGNFFNEQTLAGAKATGEGYQAAQKRIETFNRFLKQLTTEEAVAGTLFDEEKLKKGEDLLKKQLAAIEKIRDAAKEVQGRMFDLKEIDAATDKLAGLETQVGDLKLQIAVRDAKKAGLPPAEIEKLKDAIKLDTQKRLNEAFEKEALLLEFGPKVKFSPTQRLDLNEIASRMFTSKEKITLSLGEKGVEVDVKKIPVDITDLQGKIAKATGLDKAIPVITLHKARVLVNGEKLTAEIEGKEKILEDLNRQIAGIFEGGLNDAFGALGESFGESLLTGDFGEGLKKAAQSILGVLGNVMQQIGKAVIAAAIKIELLKKALETWAIKNPALAILAGVGLVAAGAALKNMKFDGPKFADGGIVSSPVIGQIGERFRPEVIMPLDRLPQLFKQFGSDFNGGMQFIPIINNEGLYLAMKRGERSAGRKF